MAIYQDYVFQNIVLVDCHNSFKGEAGELLPTEEGFDLMDAIIDCKSKGNVIKVGCSYDPMDNFSKEDGIGQSGLKVLVVNVENQKTAYILLDSNNMVIGYRKTIIEEVKKLGKGCCRGHDHRYPLCKHTCRGPRSCGFQEKRGNYI